MPMSQQRKRRLALPLAVILAILCRPRTGSAQAWNWSTEQIDLEGYSTSLIVDTQGNLHLSYYATNDGELRYGFRSAANSRWFKMAVDHSLGFMVTAITLDSHQNPHICYTPQVTKYAAWDGHKWHTQEVDPGIGRVAFFCSIQITSDGKPEIAWYLESGTFLRYAVLQDGVWLAMSVEGGGGRMPGKWNSMVLDANGNPHIAYTWFPTGKLNYSFFDGQTWNIATLDSPTDTAGGERGMGVSMVLDPDGNPIIAYYDEQSLKLARNIKGKWKSEVIEQLPPFGQNYSWKSFRSKLLFDSKGNLHVGFESLRGLEHAWWDGKQWNKQLILGVHGLAFLESSMAIDASDNLYIVYRDPQDKTLELAIGRPAAEPMISSTGAAN